MITRYKELQDGTAVFVHSSHEHHRDSVPLPFPPRRGDEVSSESEPPISLTSWGRVRWSHSSDYGSVPPFRAPSPRLTSTKTISWRGRCSPSRAMGACSSSMADSLHAALLGGNLAQMALDNGGRASSFSAVCVTAELADCAGVRAAEAASRRSARVYDQPLYFAGAGFAGRLPVRDQDGILVAPRDLLWEDEMAPVVWLACERRQEHDVYALTQARMPR